MMIMRQPQQRHGRGRTWGSSAAAVSDVSACCGRDGTASSWRRPCDVGGAMAVGEQSLVADAMQILGQHVRQEAPNKLMNKFRELGFVEYNGGLSVQSSLMNVVLHD
jgi:hypothetical protein